MESFDFEAIYKSANKDHEGVGRFFEMPSKFLQTQYEKTVESALKNAEVDNRLKVKIFNFFVFLATFSFAVVVLLVGFIAYYSLRDDINIEIFNQLISVMRFMVVAVFAEILLIIGSMVFYLFSDRHKNVFKAIREKPKDGDVASKTIPRSE